MLAVVASVLGGMNLPSSRNERALDMRSSAEADGERRMMGSGLLDGPFWLSASAGLDPMADEDDDFFWINGKASLRT